MFQRVVLAPGDRQVDVGAVEREVGEAVERAPAAWVREQTGFAVGGIPPLGHDVPLAPLIDPALVALPRVWAAAGTPHAVFAVASVLARGLRFFLVAALLWKFGPPIRTFIEKRLGLVFTVFVAGLIGGFVVIKFLH